MADEVKLSQAEFEVLNNRIKESEENLKIVLEENETLKTEKSTWDEQMSKLNSDNENLSKRNKIYEDNYSSNRKPLKDETRQPEQEIDLNTLEV